MALLTHGSVPVKSELQRPWNGTLRSVVAACLLSPRPVLRSFHAEDAGAESRVPAPGSRVGGQREREVVHSKGIDPLEHDLGDPKSSSVRGPVPQVRQRPEIGAASASRRAMVAPSRPRSRSFANCSAARSRSRLIRALTRTSPPSDCLACATVSVLSRAETATCSKARPTAPRDLAELPVGERRRVEHPCDRSDARPRATGRRSSRGGGPPAPPIAKTSHV